MRDVLRKNRKKKQHWKARECEGVVRKESNVWFNPRPTRFWQNVFSAKRLAQKSVAQRRNK
eukprot:8076513-Prorocentrum_lima.AAC.1